MVGKLKKVKDGYVIVVEDRQYELSDKNNYNLKLLERKKLNLSFEVEGTKSPRAIITSTVHDNMRNLKKVDLSNYTEKMLKDNGIITLTIIGELDFPPTLNVTYASGNKDWFYGCHAIKKFLKNIK